MSNLGSVPKEIICAEGGKRIPRHPHTGLATVSWLFSGNIAHRDSAGY
jgi:redox-sensitive bicupin YhaK (pirin superfamily)